MLRTGGCVRRFFDCVGRFTRRHPAAAALLLTAAWAAVAVEAALL